MLLQGMEGGWVVIEASHTVRSGLNVTCHMLIRIFSYNSLQGTFTGFVTWPPFCTIIFYKVAK